MSSKEINVVHKSADRYLSLNTEYHFKQWTLPSELLKAITSAACFFDNICTFIAICHMNEQR